MKDNSLDGHRGKVALSDTTRNAASSSTPSSSSVVVKCDLKTPASTANDGSTATNFDDDYNEWELGIGDLIIDLDADIEKTNERNGSIVQQGLQQQNGTATTSPTSAVHETSPTSAAATFSFLGSPCTNNANLAAAMSNSKSPRLSGNSNNVAGTASSSGTGVTSSVSGNSSASAQGSGTFEHQATVDKGLKMKIKRKTVGSKYSEAKHEIVQSDTKTLGATSHNLPDNSSASSNNNNSASSAATNSPANNLDTPKSKHSSSKGRNSSHREKKEKNRDKDKNSGARNSLTSTSSSEMNGVLGVMSPLKITSSGVSLSSPAPPPLSSSSSPLPCTTVSTNVSSITSVVNSPISGNCGQESSVPPPGVSTLLNLPLQAVASSSPPMPNLTLKLETKFTPSPTSMPCTGALATIKQEDGPTSPPLKKIKMENSEPNGELECPASPNPEMKDASTCISVGTITEPDCLGPCEPGTSVMLEGIVWQETDGGVLVVNVTWRGKSYIGTLLDCTKHDWAPPRFCESPTSDVDSKTSKGRGKRGRGGNNSSGDLNFADARNCVQSKLRNGKGRRTTVNSN